MKDEKNDASLRKAEADQRFKRFLEILLEADLKVMKKLSSSKTVISQCHQGGILK